jgi:hypothetical protein
MCQSAKLAGDELRYVKGITPAIFLQRTAHAGAARFGDMNKKKFVFM